MLKVSKPKWAKTHVRYTNDNGEIVCRPAFYDESDEIEERVYYTTCERDREIEDAVEITEQECKEFNAYWEQRRYELIAAALPGCAVDARNNYAPVKRAIACADGVIAEIMKSDYYKWSK